MVLVLVTGSQQVPSRFADTLPVVVLPLSKPFQIRHLDWVVHLQQLSLSGPAGGTYTKKLPRSRNWPGTRLESMARGCIRSLGCAKFLPPRGATLRTTRKLQTA